MKISKIIAAIILISMTHYSQAQEGETPVDEIKKLNITGFSFEHELNLPGTPEIIFDAVTGDISGWWDHSFSDDPYKLYIEPKPGGGFWEIFDEEGNGVKHADVIFAQRGKMLRFEGPLGLSGKAVQMVHAYSFEPVGDDSTKLMVSVHAMGEFGDEMPKIINNVWKHFLFEQLKPYVETGKHLGK